MKDKIRTEYFRRVKRLLRSKLNGGNMVSAINTGSIAGALHGRDCQMEKRRVGNNGQTNKEVDDTSWRECAPPSDIWFPGPTQLTIPSAISIGTAVFAQLTAESTYKNRKRLSVCLCHDEQAIGDCRYFLAPCDNRPPARPARIPLGDTLCGYRTVVSVSSAL